MEEGLTEIRERIIPDSKSQKEAVRKDPRVWINQLSTDEKLVASWRLSEGHPKVVVEAQL